MEQTPDAPERKPAGDRLASLPPPRHPLTGAGRGPAAFLALRPARPAARSQGPSRSTGRGPRVGSSHTPGPGPQRPPGPSGHSRWRSDRHRALPRCHPGHPGAPCAPEGASWPLRSASPAFWKCRCLRGGEGCCTRLPGLHPAQDLGRGAPSRDVHWKEPSGAATARAPGSRKGGSRGARSCRGHGWAGVAARAPVCPVTDLNETLHATGHGKLFAVRRPGLLGHRVLRQPPALLHHQLLGREERGRTRLSEDRPPGPLPPALGESRGWEKPSDRVRAPHNCPGGPGSRADRHAHDGGRGHTCRAPTGLHSDC